MQTARFERARSTISQEKSESSEMNNSVATADPNLSKRRVALRLATLAWAVLVFYLSTERFGSDFSQGLLAQALTVLHISVSPRTLHILDTLLRKTAHMTEYGILAFLVYGSFAEQQPFRWRLRQAIWCIGIVGLYSLIWSDRVNTANPWGCFCCFSKTGPAAVGADVSDD